MTLSNLKPWAIRFALGLGLLYAAWWWLQADLTIIAGLKVVMESWLPALFSDLKRLTTAPSGGWLLHTAIAPVNDPTVNLTLEVDLVFLRRAITWIPAVMALVWATAPRVPRRWIEGLVAALVTSALLVTICVAAHLAVLVNGTPSLLDDDTLPKPPDFPTTSLPYPVGYFHAVTFAFYLTVIVAPMVMPVLLWGWVCRRELITPVDR